MANKYRIPNERGKLVFTSKKKFIRYHIDAGTYRTIEHIPLTPKEEKEKDRYINFERFRRANGTFIPKNQQRFLKDFYKNINVELTDVSKKDIRELIDSISERKTNIINTIDIERKLIEHDKNGGEIKINGKTYKLAEALEILREKQNDHRKEKAKAEEIKESDVYIYSLGYEYTININTNTIDLDLTNPFDVYKTKKADAEKRIERSSEETAQADKKIKQRKAALKGWETRKGKKK